MKADRDNSTPCAYRLYNEHGVLLYVGSTTSLIRRLGQHLRSAPWWPEVSRIEFDRCANMREASKREIRSARLIQPLHNTHYTDRPGNGRGTRETQIFEALTELGEGGQWELENYFYDRCDTINWVGGSVLRMAQRGQIRVIRREPSIRGRYPTRAIYGLLVSGA
jgi:hypothetical protein